MNEVAAATAPTIFGELIESLDLISASSQIPQGTCRPGSGYMRIRSGKPHTKKHLVSHLHEKMLDSSPSKKMKPI
jgi:hypothetical protein